MPGRGTQRQVGQILPRKCPKPTWNDRVEGEEELKFYVIRIGIKVGASTVGSQKR